MPMFTADDLSFRMLPKPLDHGVGVAIGSRRPPRVYRSRRIRGVATALWLASCGCRAVAELGLKPEADRDETTAAASITGQQAQRLRQSQSRSTAQGKDQPAKRFAGPATHPVTACHRISQRSLKPCAGSLAPGRITFALKSRSQP